MAIETATRRVFVVFNPSSGRAVPEEVWRGLAEGLGAVDSGFEVHETAQGEDIAATARAAAGRGFAVIVAAGGDGTVALVANGLIGTPARLGIVPLGTANVLAHELGIPIEPAEACQLLAGPNSTTTIDGMRVGGVHFFTQIGVGIDALMIRDTTPDSKRRFGILAYLWNAAKRLLGFQPQRFWIEVDGRETRMRAAQVLLANCGALGASGLRWGPSIRSDDGHIDVCIVRARTLLDYLGVAWSILRGRHHDARSLKYLIAERHATVRAGRPLPVQADGELIGETPVEVRVVPRVLPVIVPLG